jgi:hypothetical protein
MAMTATMIPPSAACAAAPPKRDNHRESITSALAREALGGVASGDAGGEYAEIVGQGAVGELGDACA